MVMVLGCASWAGAWTYSVEMDGTDTVYAKFEKGAGDSSITLDLWYGNADGDYYHALTSAAGNSYDSNDWTIIAGGAATEPDHYESSVSFLLMFKGAGNNATPQTINGKSLTDLVYFEFNQGDINVGGEPDKCVAVVQSSPAVPIPGAVWLLGSGLGSLLIARRKRKA